MSVTPLGFTVQVAKALGHPTRLRILTMLRHGPLSVCQITSVLHSVASTVSGHLLELRRSGLVVERRDGRFVHYRQSEDGAILQVLEAILPLLARDTQIRDDAALAEAIQAVSLASVCESKSPVGVP